MTESTDRQRLLKRFLEDQRAELAAMALLNADADLIAFTGAALCEALAEVIDEEDDDGR